MGSDHVVIQLISTVYKFTKNPLKLVLVKDLPSSASASTGRPDTASPQHRRFDETADRRRGTKGTDQSQVVTATIELRVATGKSR